MSTGDTVSGQPAVEQPVSRGSGDDVRNASVVLGLLSVAVLAATGSYWRHTGRAARRRARAQRLSKQRIEDDDRADTRVGPWPTPSTSTR